MPKCRGCGCVVTGTGMANVTYDTGGHINVDVPDVVGGIAASPADVAVATVVSGSTSATRAALDARYSWGLVAAVVADPASVAANGALDVALTVTGAAAGNACLVTPGTPLEAGLGIAGCWATTNTVTFRLRNFTASAIDPASRTWAVRVWK